MVYISFHFVAIVIGLALSSAFIVFICIRLSAVVPREPELRGELGFQLKKTNKGLEPIKLAAFPTMIYNSEVLHSREDIQCSICLGEYQQSELIRTLPTCGHCFHLICIDSWLHNHSTCPVCRLSLNDSDDSLIEILQAMEVDSPPLHPLTHP
ncbi:RING-H2 finger protein ATL78-like [Dioscorea cayenensis subsp. rotundata]|uniref:RING-type E3 ubiquitin transferase n=1 Tax=Dioscorea cayennensis subsp. rotundata TaxID=55577 RepID=A0AB40AIS0_DIOCR|nr:RING-H2 finger protein ATL78-like [Dioscorea cayenensis subsp. rotundata]